MVLSNTMPMSTGDLIMCEHNVKLTVPADSALYLWFEPWAEGWAVPAGSEIELRARSDFEGTLEIEETAERTAM